jgi:hypothetical protein
MSSSMILCPGCGVHVRKANGCEMTCPFCETTFSLPCTKSTGLADAAKRGVVAASIVGATVLGAGCLFEEPVSLYGMPPDLNNVHEDVGDDADAGQTDADEGGVNNVALYGMPPDLADADADDATDAGESDGSD